MIMAMDRFLQWIRSLVDVYVQRRLYAPEPGVWLVPIGRSGFTYHFESYAAEVEAEMLVGPINYVIYSSTIEKWLPPHENEQLTEEDRQRIIRCLCKYLDHYRNTYELER
jgi:hypothetical protein